MTGCESQGAAKADSTTGESVRIAYLGYTTGDYPGAVVKGVRSVVARSGGSVTAYNANFDAQKQLSQCQDVVTSKRYQAIVLAPVDPATGAPCVQVAKAAGIPVATVETAVGKDPYSLEPQQDGVVAVVGDPLESEVDVDSQLIKAACGTADPCKVIAEVTTATDRFTNDVVKGVGQKLGPKVKFVQKIQGFYNPGEVAKAMPDALSAHGDVNVFFGASDQTALATLPAFKEAGLAGKVKIIGRGGSSEGAAAVADGTLFGTSGNWPQQYGVFLAKALVEAVHGRPVKPESLDMLKTDTPAVVTKDNVAKFKPEWGSSS
ncbi:sugar ABC transporter substrate-binding protein [Streptomyces sp. NPDC057474]|uniref:sugar ABC transporter substrate-binding protein n=1 Tax=Streptomyces sp. NPDC057474 TaxID=3346144 RepID=UPI0036909B18